LERKIFAISFKGKEQFSPTVKAKASGASLSCDRTRFEFCDKPPARVRQDPEFIEEQNAHPSSCDA